LTGGHFAKAAAPAGIPARSTPVDGPHGTITPFTSSAVWPTDTPPSSAGSGGGPPVDTVNSNSGGSNGGASGGLNNANNGTSGGSNTSGTNSGGGVASGGMSGGSNSGGCNCDCSGGASSGTGSMTSSITNGASDFMIENASGVADHSISSPSVYSPAGVRYADGQINITGTDLSTDGFGSSWNQTRSWSNGSAPSSNNGTSWIDMDRPYLLNSYGEIIVVSSATDARYFTLTGGYYQPQFFRDSSFNAPKP
jgi:hypothetical protein